MEPPSCNPILPLGLRHVQTHPEIDAADGAIETDDGPEAASTRHAGPLESPPFDAALRTSTATGLSHLSGRRCLDGCHAKGGEARRKFVAAGTRISIADVARVRRQRAAWC